jgi:hypothetical protein
MRAEVHNLLCIPNFLLGSRTCLETRPQCLAIMAFPAPNPLNPSPDKDLRLMEKPVAEQIPGTGGRAPVLRILAWLLNRIEESKRLNSLERIAGRALIVKRRSLYRHHV